MLVNLQKRENNELWVNYRIPVAKGLSVWLLIFRMVLEG